MQRDQGNPLKKSGSASTAGMLAVGLGLSAVAAALVRRWRRFAKVAEPLRSVSMFLMPSLSPATVPLVRGGTRMMSLLASAPAGMDMRVHQIPGMPDQPDVRVVVLHRSQRARNGPALLWLHGGGYLFGTPEMDLRLLARLLQSVDTTIVSVDYRVAPRHPFPAALDDAMAALRWVGSHSNVLGIDPRQVAVGGNSAGGGLAAALAQRARDEGISVVFQLLMYPMLDDRTVCRANYGGRGELVWSPSANRYGWASYLGHPPGEGQPAPYASPARTVQLAGLPPAWIGVGSLDLFYDEDSAYAERLRVAGVPCHLDIIEGAPHAFDLLNFEASTVRRFHDGMAAALAGAYA